jgi:TPR repeat protein
MSHRTDFLKDLMMANDPALVETVRGEAMLGNPHALYALGLIYAEGRGVQRNLVAAYAWLTVAVMHGDADAELLRNHVAIDMTDEEFDEGKRCAASYQEDIRASMKSSTSH